MNQPHKGRSRGAFRTVQVTSADAGSGSDAASLITVLDSDSGTGTESWRLEAARRFYVTHRRWLAAQLALVIGSGAAGVFIGLTAGTIVGALSGAGLSILSGLIGIFLIPSWRTEVDERRITSG